jgi:prephenate dehydrogenase
LIEHRYNERHWLRRGNSLKKQLKTNNQLPVTHYQKASLMTTINVSILGLGLIGTSVGLALKRNNARKDARQQFSIVGFDTDDSSAETARKKGAVDSLARNPADAAANKDIVVLSLPYGEVQGAYRAIGDILRPGTVVLDASPLKLPSIEWADKYLVSEAHMVGITPVLNPTYLFDGADDTDHAAADLFDKGTMLLMPSVKSAKDAVELAAHFSELLGATPRFADPVEHDGWIAAMEGLPALLGLGLFHMLREDEGWDDAQRVGNPSFGRLTHHLYDTHPDDMRDLLLQNRQNIVRQVDQLIETLRTLRGILAENNRAALEEALIESAKAYNEWLLHRQNARWDDNEPGRPQSRDLLMGGLLGGYLSKRLRGGKDDED